MFGPVVIWTLGQVTQVWIRWREAAILALILLLVPPFLITFLWSITGVFGLEYAFVSGWVFCSIGFMAGNLKVKEELKIIVGTVNVVGALDYIAIIEILLALIAW